MCVNRELNSNEIDDGRISAKRWRLRRMEGIWRSI
jgi:hypothetical protein